MIVLQYVRKLTTGPSISIFLSSCMYATAMYCRKMIRARVRAQSRVNLTLMPFIQAWKFTDVIKCSDASAKLDAEYVSEFPSRMCFTFVSVRSLEWKMIWEHED